MTILTLLFAIWLMTVIVILLVFFRPLASLWHEPVFCTPVFVLESDDWGAGSLEQAAALNKMSSLLSTIRDKSGHPVVMTIGIVPAIADREAMKRESFQHYRRVDLLDPKNSEIVLALHSGITAGVFVPQLHGLEHYWPSSLMKSAPHDGRVREWLNDDNAPTESLTDALQSRWIDASTLPSIKLHDAEINEAVTQECKIFRELFNQDADVAVPNTFVWTRAVERAWINNGVTFVVTPGTRYESRNESGELVGTQRKIFNGKMGTSGVTYLVRDVYFEPARGHSAAKLVKDIRTCIDLGRPCLVETHRFNFIGDKADASFAALKTALEAVVNHFPSIRFMSTANIGYAMVNKNPDIIEQWPPGRWNTWMNRVMLIPRFNRLAKYIGIEHLLRLLGFVGSKLAAYSQRATS